jgi:hypothetical protein
MIRPHENLGSQARFIAALCAKSDWILFQDNDVAVGRRTIEALLRYSEQVGAPCVMSVDGRRLTVDSLYTKSEWIRTAQKLERIDISLGHVELVPRQVLPQILTLFPFGNDGRMDDILFSSACAHSGVPLYVAPLVQDENIVEFPNRGIGACYDADHYAERDRLCQRLF